MDIDIDFIDMVRDTYKPQLITALQDTQEVLRPFFTTMPGKGKQVVMDAIGTTEMTPRTQRFEPKVLNQELEYGRRCFHASAWKNTLVKSNDDDYLRGDFTADLADFVAEQRNALIRTGEQVALGTVYSNSLKDYVIKTPYNPSGAGNLDFYYNDSAAEGLMGTNWTGELLNVPEALPMQPVLASTGAAATAYTDFTKADDIDYEKSNVLPVNFVKTGTPTLSGLILDKIITAGIMLQCRHAMKSGEEYCMAITPLQAQELIMTDKLQNSLYGFQSLPNGMISKLLGIRFLVTPYVPIVNVGTTEDPHYVRACPVWRTQDAVFGTWMNPKFDIVEHKEGYYDLVSSTVQASFGACRKRVENVLTIHCEEGRLDRLNSAA